ncbi:hypothetical protein FS749_006179 [Ceratobasidium sp. UAMH 11750]|nr:hypothetical protein FS749_006179 [Ceratobasidium sp. UAMH 11750]
MRIQAWRRLPPSGPTAPIRCRSYSARSGPLTRDKIWDRPNLKNQPPAVRKSIYTLGGLFFLASSGYVLYKAHQPTRHFCLAVVRCSRVAKAVIEGVIDYKILFARNIPDDVLRTQAYSSLHIARDRATGRQIAVKLQHPHLAEFAEIDITTTTLSLAFVRRYFPTFEFSWLGEELATNLPLEMDFVHEARNTAKVTANFNKIPKGKTSVYVPEVLRATPRTLVMEYVKGGRVDDLEYLASHNIDRNVVSQELSRAFSEMVYIHGFFHADPHAGNLLIRPAPPNSRSPYNFEIVLLDHGLYFDLDDDLRLNYARLWLALIAPGFPPVARARRRYAEAMNISSDLYPIFESAITGRAGFEGTWDTPAGDDLSSMSFTAPEDSSDALEPTETSSAPAPTPAEAPKFRRARGMLDVGPQSKAEVDAIRKAVLEQEGVVEAVFDLLRKVPRRVLMILKLNDLTRSLDHALTTTHSEVRVFVIMARYCSRAVWEDARKHAGWSLELVGHWLAYVTINKGLRVVEWWMDTRARAVIALAWARGLLRDGRHGASRAAAGLA